MTLVTIVRGNIVTPTVVLYGGHLVIVDEIIVGVHESTTPIPTAEDLSKKYPDPKIVIKEGSFIVPGFVDIHNHGLGGYSDVIGHWSNPEYSLQRLAKCGTLTTLASLIFSEDHKDLVTKCIDAVESRVGKYIPDCCQLGGIHAEGPIIHDRGGLPQCSNRMSLQAFKDLCATMPSMKVMTISPHVDAQANYEKIRYLLEKKVRPALGHDRVAKKSEILGALKLAKEKEDQFHLTHVGNVMSFNHREPSLVNMALTSRFPKTPQYEGAIPPTIEVIADLIHVDAVTVNSLLLSRKPADIAIITDCISEHVPGKHISYNGRSSVVRAEGGCSLCDAFGRPSGTLAGGTGMLADLFYNLISVFGVDIVTACIYTATTPARVARLDDVGSIAVGKKANILLLNSELTAIEKRMICGNWLSHDKYTLLRPSAAHM